jgi:hypothetical protein
VLAGFTENRPASLLQDRVSYLLAAYSDAQLRLFLDLLTACTICRGSSSPAWTRTRPARTSPPHDPPVRFGWRDARGRTSRCPEGRLALRPGSRLRAVQRLEADQRAGQVAESQQDVRAPLVAHPQPPVTEAATPATAPPHTGDGPACRSARCHAAQSAGRSPAGAAPADSADSHTPCHRAAWPATWALDRRHGIHHGLQQHRIMGIDRRQPHGQRDAAAVDQQVVLGAGLAAVCRGSGRSGSPHLARTPNESRLARVQSIRPSRPS